MFPNGVENFNPNGIFCEDCYIRCSVQFKRILYIESLEGGPKLLGKFIDGHLLLEPEHWTRKKNSFSLQGNRLLFSLSDNIENEYSDGSGVSLRKPYTLHQLPLNYYSIFRNNNEEKDSFSSKVTKHLMRKIWNHSFMSEYKSYLKGFIKM